MTFISLTDFTIEAMPWPISKSERKELIKLGERIKAIRVEKGLSMEDVAKKIGKDRQSIHKLEKGDFNPSYLYLKQISLGLEIEIAELFVGNAKG